MTDASTFGLTPTSSSATFGLSEPEKPSLGERIEHGFAEPFLGAAQLASKLGMSGGVGDGGFNPGAEPPVPPSEVYGAATKEIRDFKKRDPGFDWAELLGNVMNPLNYIVPASPAASFMGKIGAAALSGMGAALFQPVEGDDFAKTKAEQLAGGAALGGGLSAVGQAVATAAHPIVIGIESRFPSIFPKAAGKRAIELLDKRMAQDEKAPGGPTIADMRKELASTPDKPRALIDVTGRNARGLGGSVARAAGQAREEAHHFFETRDAEAGNRMLGDIDKHIAKGGSAYHVIKDKIAERLAKSRPLYEIALAPGSVAPLRYQFEQGYRELSAVHSEAQAAEAQASTKVQLALAKVHRAGNNVYSNSAARRELVAAQAEQHTARNQLAAIGVDFKDAVETMRDAQEAEAQGLRGGVWSPYLNRLWKHEPVIQKAMKKGLAYQRIEAHALDKPYNPMDHAIIGVEENGAPIAGKVPNMRTWDAAKKGIDALLEKHRNELTGKIIDNEETRHLNMLRRGLIKELDRLNPYYKEARAAFAGPSEALDAIQMGKEFARLEQEQIPDLLEDIGSNKDFFMLGVRDRMRHLVQKAVDMRRDPSPVLLGARRILRPMFESDEAFNKFEKDALAEANMRARHHEITGGSQTAGRVVEDAGDAELLHDLARLTVGIGAATHGLPLYGAAITSQGVRGLRGRLIKPTEATRNELGKMLFSSDQSVIDKALRAVEAHRRPPTPTKPARLTKPAVIASDQQQ